MRRLISKALLLSFVLVPVALAHDAAKATSADLRPKPAQALTDAFKGMAGTWTCKGKFQRVDGSGEMANKSTMVIKPALDGFAYSGEYRVEKNALLPNGMKGQMFWSYDSVKNQLVEFTADSFGGTGHGTSEGLTGDSVVWDQDGAMMGQPAKSRTTVKHVGPKDVTLTFEVQTDGKWETLGLDSCKKQ
jgi:hypothetical protein